MSPRSAPLVKARVPGLQVTAPGTLAGSQSSRDAAAQTQLVPNSPRDPLHRRETRFARWSDCLCGGGEDPVRPTLAGGQNRREATVKQRGPACPTLDGLSQGGREGGDSGSPCIFKSRNPYESAASAGCNGTGHLIPPGVPSPAHAGPSVNIGTK